jgi:competence protein ComK
MINEYYINEDTLILVPSSKNKTQIYDKEGIYEINTKLIDIVEKSCNYYGSSFLGRCVGSKSILNMNYKLPIIMDEVKEVIMIPTTSPNNNNCCWICLNNIEDYYKQNNKIIIEFSNKTTYEIDTSYYSLENQILRATLLLTKLRKRKNILKKIS